MTAQRVIDLDLQSVRRQFRALSRRVEGQPVVYLDNPAGTQVPQRVIDRTADYWRTMNANRGGAFVTSESTDALLSEVRRAAAVFLHPAPGDALLFCPHITPPPTPAPPSLRPHL